MTDLHVTNNDGPNAWLPVIEEIKNASKKFNVSRCFYFKNG
jgi:hypothetical protein